MYQNASHDKRYRKTLSFLEKHVPKGSSILDLGVKNPLSQLMEQQGYNVENTSGEDLDEDKSALIQSKAEVVTAFEILEHLLSSYELLKKKIRPKVATIYTGPPDVFFNFKYGKLDWRSLEFKFNTLKRNKIQECVQINFPNDYKYTRKVEIKHVTKQRSNYTVISKEYPTGKGDPYYPIMDKSNIKMFKKYEKLMNSLSKKNIYFEGRLARYKYFNTDQVIEKALDLFNLLKFKYRKK